MLLSDCAGGEDGGEKGDEGELEIGHVLEDLGGVLGEGRHVAGAVGGAAGGENVGDENDEEAEVSAADESVAAFFPAGLHDAEQDGVSGQEAPEIIGDAEHGVTARSLW